MLAIKVKNNFNLIIIIIDIGIKKTYEFRS